MLKCCGNELSESLLPKKLSLSAQGSVWVESSESPWTSITDSSINTVSNWIDFSNARIKQKINVLKQILERRAKGLWKHKRAARLAINTPQMDLVALQMACHEFKQPKLGVGKNHHHETSSTGSKFSTAEKIGLQNPFVQTAAALKQPYSARSPEPSTLDLPSWVKAACRAAKYIVAEEPRVIHRSSCQNQR